MNSLITCPHCHKKFDLTEGQLDGAHEQVKELREQMLAMSRENMALKQKSESMELEIQKRLHAEYGKMEGKMQQNYAQKHELQIRLREQKIDDLRKVIDQLQAKALTTSASGERIGEVAELDFEKSLKEEFPQDKVTAISKGLKGADLSQEVYLKASATRAIGTILWEFKNTKTFAKGWIQKLKEDLREARATVAVLVSKNLPQDFGPIEFKDGVYIIDFSLTLPLAKLLRQQLITLDRQRAANEGRKGKMDLMYEYLTGEDFRHKLTSVVKAYTMQKEQLEQERRALTRIWARREKQLDIVIDSATSLVGDLEGIVGLESLPKVDNLGSLELEP